MASNLFKEISIIEVPKLKLSEIHLPHGERLHTIGESPEISKFTVDRYGNSQESREGKSKSHRIGFDLNKLILSMQKSEIDSSIVDQNVSDVSKMSEVSQTFFTGLAKVLSERAEEYL